MRKLSVATILVIAAVAGCEKQEEKSAIMPQRPPAPVQVAVASTRDVPVYLKEIGRTAASEIVSVIPQVSGQIIARHFVDGQEVKKGDLLFEIDPRPYQAALASANATLAQNQAQVVFARNELNRAESIASTGGVSQSDIDQKRSSLQVAEAQVGVAKAAIETAAINLNYTKIYSPIDGRTGMRLVDVGNVVTANAFTPMGQSLLMIQRLNPIYADFTIPENDLGTVRKYIAMSGKAWTEHPENGLTALVDLPADSQRVLAALGGMPTTQATTRSTAGPREGELTFLDTSVQNASGTIKLRATLKNADHYFWPGQFVNVTLVLTVKKDAVLIPQAAEQIGQQGPYVYVVTPESTAEIRPITPGQSQGDLLVVEQGLKAGEKVVTTGQMLINPGGKVMVMPEQNGAQAAQQTAAAK